MSEKLVIGVGNEFRGDDAAGLHIARKVKEAAPPGVSVLENGGDAASMIDAWKDFQHVIVVDAVKNDSSPGTIYRIDVKRQGIPPFLSTAPSTHLLCLADAVALAESLNTLPERLIIYGVEGQNFDYSSTMSPTVLRAAGKAARMVIDEISNELNIIM